MAEMLYWLFFGPSYDVVLCAPVVAFIPAIVSLATAAFSMFGGSKQKEPGIVKPPGEDRIAKADAEQRRRQLGARGFQSTILSDLAGQHGLKTSLGG